MVYSSWVRTMRKKKSNLREYEKNNRVINIPQARNDRRERLEIQKSKAQKKDNYIKIAVCAVVAILIVYFGVSAIKIIKLNNEMDEVTAYNRELLKDKESLQLELENINSADYIESQARRDLKLIKPNELLFIFPEKDYSKIENENTQQGDKQE